MKPLMKRGSFRCQILTLFLILFVGFGCSSFREPEPRRGIIYPPELQNIESMIRAKKTKDALQFLDNYLSQPENLRFFGQAFYLRGYVYEAEGDVEKAVNNYRQSIQHGSRYDSLVEAKALYNLSFTYERANRFAELVGVLRDLRQRASFFRPITGQVETPARLASAHFGLGQMKKGLQYHESAAKNFLSLARGNGYKANALLHTRVLYYLSALAYSENEETFANLLKKFNLGQKYLIECTEGGTGSWSTKCALLGLQGYKKLFQFIEDYDAVESSSKVPLDRMAGRRQTQGRQLEMASDFYDLLLKSAVSEFPLERMNRNSQKLLQASDYWKRRLEFYVSHLELGPHKERGSAVSNRPLSRYSWELNRPLNPASSAPVRINPEFEEPVPLRLESPLSPTRVSQPALLSQKNGKVIQEALDKEFQKGEHKKKMKKLIEKELKSFPQEDPNL